MEELIIFLKEMYKRVNLGVLWQSLWYW